MSKIELDDDDLQLLKNQPSIWNTWIDAMQRHFDWDPEHPEELIEQLLNTTVGTRL